jgi:AAA ATPase domain
MLFGRDAERAEIGTLLDAARQGRSGVLVLRGEPGVGKTALLEDARDRAADMYVLTARGVESESELPFATVHQLVRPGLDLMERLPARQAAALRGALGLGDGAGEERFLVFAACLTLLSELAERRPVLCLVSGYGLGLSTTKIGLVLLPTAVACALGGWTGGRLVDRTGPRALVAAGSLLGIAAYASLALAHDTAVALASGSAVLGLAWGFILTGIYPVVIRGASIDKTTVAIAVNVVMRNTAVAVGVSVAFAIIIGAGLAGEFPADSGYTGAFVMGAVGAGATLLAAALLHGRTARAR